MNDDIYKLLAQIAQTEGHDNIKNYTIYEVSNWLQEREKAAKVYAQLLQEELNIDFNKPNYIEILKSRHDSIALLNDNTSIISPYMKNVKVLNQERIINANFAVSTNGIPLIINPKDKFDATPIDIKKSLIFMNHNPYTQSDIEGLDRLHNNQTASIILGFYGNIKDEDRIKKLVALKKFKDKLNGDYIEEHIKQKDIYCSLIATKNLTRMRTR